MDNRGPVPGVYRPDQVRREPDGPGGCGPILVLTVLGWVALIGLVVAVGALFGVSAP